MTLCAGRLATLIGTPGTDALVGTARPDVIAALGGNDTIGGGGDNDTVCSGPGADTIRGGAGNDTLNGGPGTDRFYGGPGNDTINSRDPCRETVDCGLGRQDRVTADRVDRLVSCEIARRGWHRRRRHQAHFSAVSAPARTLGSQQPHPQEPIEMSTWMMPRRACGARWAAVGIGSLLAAAGLASRASAEHSLLEQVSTGPSGGNGDVQANFAGVSADGSRVFYTTAESLVSADTDTAVDVYERSGGETTLVSIGATGNSAFPVTFVGASANGTRVFFRTFESLVSTDTDTGLDIYERSGGQTTLISTGPTGGNDTDQPFFVGASADGTRVFFRTFRSRW